ncbi:MAG: Ribose-phosphate pyrophosphokinase [Planctomycetes bacterium ADurb.Bin126]|nr:MAG: Ribose-phosphate pyrophosphokinase [Planctomycetes bacterium ADurb.Bin126]HOD83022.1 ribose-phosphate pyrophosphokinase [Phycisphaerae bacterium]HQL71554.1 ribose-phosphate pyrophosphokinase [Phycisphaerae bacterium]
MSNLKLFAGRANLPLASKISDYLGVGLGAVKINAFPDGELMVKLEEDVRGRDVFIIQPTCEPVNETLIELLVFIDCARRASAERITAVIPYFGYARQDRKDEGRTPITAKLVANLIATAGADRVLTMDLHAAQIQGFFDIPVDNLLAEPVLSRYFVQRGLENLVLVSPDVGNTKRARVYAERLGGELAIINKRRVSGEEVAVGRIIGDVRDKTVLMMDDMISTAGTVCGAAVLCREEGAKQVFVGATHGVLCGPAIERLGAAPIDEIIVTDTIPVGQDKVQQIGKLRVLSVAGLMGEAIHRIHNDESVSSLFAIENGGQA